MLSFCVGVGGTSTAGELDARGTQAIELVAYLKRALTFSLASLKVLASFSEELLASTVS